MGIFGLYERSHIKRYWINQMLYWLHVCICLRLLAWNAGRSHVKKTTICKKWGGGGEGGKRPLPLPVRAYALKHVFSKPKHTDLVANPLYFTLWENDRRPDKTFFIEKHKRDDHFRKGALTTTWRNDSDSVNNYIPFTNIVIIIFYLNGLLALFLLIYSWSFKEYSFKDRLPFRVSIEYCILKYFAIKLRANSTG